MKFVKLIINRKTKTINLQMMSTYDMKTNDVNLIVRSYPVVDKTILVPIICKDIELIFSQELQSFKLILENSEEYLEIEGMVNSLNLDYGNDIDDTDLHEVLIRKTTYYFRRFMKEFVNNTDARNYNRNGFSLDVRLKDILEAKKNLPREFLLLQKEFSEIIEILRRYLPIQEHIKVRLEGNLNYTKQYISEYLFETDNSMCADYFAGCFKNEHNLMSFKDTLNYEPFMDRINDAIDFLKDRNMSAVYKYLFNKRYKESKYQSPFDSLYVYVSNKVLVPPIEEETFYLNKDYATYSNLPDQFLLDGNVVIKETFKDSLKFFSPPTSIDADFLSLGETTWRAKITTDGFLLDARNLFGVNLDYIQDNYIGWFRRSKTLKVITQKVSTDSLLKSISRSLYRNSVSDRILELVKPALDTKMDKEIFDLLMIAIRQEFGNRAGVEDILNFLESSLYGETIAPINRGGLTDGFETA